MASFNFFMEAFQQNADSIQQTTAHPTTPHLHFASHLKSKQEFQIAPLDSKQFKVFDFFLINCKYWKKIGKARQGLLWQITTLGSCHEWFFLTF
jgi:hypothetical protein